MKHSRLHNCMRFHNWIQEHNFFQLQMEKARTTESFQSHQHRLSKDVCFFFAPEVQAVDLPVVPPLMECRCGLVVLESLENGTIDDNLQMNNIEY